MFVCKRKQRDDEMNTAYEQAEELRLHKLDKRRQQQAAKKKAERDRQKRFDQENKQPEEKVSVVLLEAVLSFACRCAMACSTADLGIAPAESVFVENVMECVVLLVARAHGVRWHTLRYVEKHKSMSMTVVHSASQAIGYACFCTIRQCTHHSHSSSSTGELSVRSYDTVPVAIPKLLSIQARTSF